MQRQRIVLLIGSALFLGLPGKARASDGVFEINQACAVQTGCVAGDFAGFPVALDGLTGRSFLLTSDLVVPNQNATAILVFANNMSVDLNGFTIRGVTTCTGTPASCSSTGTGNGVAVGVASVTGLEVRNGSIMGMGNRGVNVGHYGTVRDLRVRGNGGNGITAGAGCIVRDNTADHNGGDGLVTENGCSVTGNVAYGNGDDGFEIGIALSGAGGVVRGNTSTANGKDGFLVGSGTNLVENTASMNGGVGIHAVLGSVGVMARGNVAHSNDVGIRGAVFHANSVTSNTSMSVIGGSNRGRNQCLGPLVTNAFCNGSGESSPEILALCPGGPNC